MTAPVRKQTAAMSAAVFETKHEIIRDSADNRRYEQYKRVLAQKYENRKQCLAALAAVMIDQHHEEEAHNAG